MNSTYKKILVTAVTLLSVTLSSASIAADIAHAIRNNTQDNTTTENYFEIGIGAAMGVAPKLASSEEQWKGRSLFINGSYNWNGLFIEKYGESSDPFVIGYNAYNSDNWSFDVVVGSKYGGGAFTNKRFDGLDERKGSTMFGGRLTGYFGDNIFQFSAKHDISGNTNGFAASAVAGRNWQLRNWNFHGMLGLYYYNSSMNQYYYGVSAEEAARTEFTEYKPGGNVNFTAEVGVTYPITEDWVFRATARARTVSDEDMDSPLFMTSRSSAMALSTSISYVF